MYNKPLHTFHIPVLGLAYTIDSPVKVARYGINSVVSIIEDKLIELMRMHYYKQTDKTHIPITPKDGDFRARRITDYLNPINDIVKTQLEKLSTAVFEAGFRDMQVLRDASRRTQPAIFESRDDVYG